MPPPTQLDNRAEKPDEYVTFSYENERSGTWVPGGVMTPPYKQCVAYCNINYNLSAQKRYRAKIIG